MKLKNVIFDFEGEEHIDSELALAQLLHDGMLFANGRKYIETDFKDKEETMPETVVLFVNCNDVFAWACADGEELPYDKIGELYKMHMADKMWGSIKWCCKQRKLQPQDPIIVDMKKLGVWDDMMEKLPEQKEK